MLRSETQPVGVDRRRRTEQASSGAAPECMHIQWNPGGNKGAMLRFLNTSGDIKSHGGQNKYVAHMQHSRDGPAVFYAQDFCCLILCVI